MHQEMRRDFTGNLLARYEGRKIKGESVFIIAGAADSPGISNSEIEMILVAYKKSGKKSLKDSVQEIAVEHGLSRSAVYKTALKVWQNN